MTFKRLMLVAIPRLIVGVASVTALLAASGALADTYAYDALGRLASVTKDSGVITYYCYDKSGNRTYVGPVPCP
jgi:YD repeat-containing protein